MKRPLLLALTILLTMAILPRVAAQGDANPRPPITAANADQLVALAQASLGVNLYSEGAFAVHDEWLALADSVLHLYHLPDLTLQQELDSGCRVQFSPDGAYLLYHDCQRALILWDLAAGREYARIEADFFAWSFTPDGQLLLRQADAITLYTLDPFAEVARLPVNWDPMAEALAPNGQWVAYHDMANERIQLVEIATQAASDIAISGYLLGLWPSPDGRLLAAHVMDETTQTRTIRVWDAATQAERATLTPPDGYTWAGAPGQGYQLLGFSADGARLAITANQYDEDTQTMAALTLVWNTATFAASQSLAGPERTNGPINLTFAPDGSWALLESYSLAENTFTLWDTAAPAPVATLGGTYALRSLDTLPDGDLLGFARYAYDDPFGKAYGLVELATGALSGMVWHAEPVIEGHFTPDGSLLVTLTEGGTGYVWGVGEAEPAPVATNRLAYEGVSIEAGQDGTLSGEMIPPRGRWDDYPYWEQLPGYLKLQVGQEGQYGCLIEVFATADYAVMYPDAIEALAEGLDADPPTFNSHVDQWPINAGRVFRSQQQYVPLSDGGMVRYLTAYAQGAFPIYNSNLIYQALGFAHDGEYYLRALCGVSAWSLGDSFDVSARALGLIWESGGEWTEDQQAFAENIGAYYTAIDQQLTASAASGFRPTLDVLDAVIASIEVEDAPLGGDLPACNFDSLLGRNAGQARVVGGTRALYAEPAFARTNYGEVPADSLLEINTGPVCNAETLWWFVGYPGEKAIGWIPEQRNGDPWLTPVD